MQLQMQGELVYFALSMAAGILAAAAGGGIGWLHRRYRHGNWLGLLDLGYWFLVGFALFLLCFYRNSGEFRGYAVVGTLAGGQGYRILRGVWTRSWSGVRAKVSVKGAKGMKKSVAQSEKTG